MYLDVQGAWQQRGGAHINADEAHDKDAHVGQLPLSLCSQYEEWE